MLNVMVFSSIDERLLSVSEAMIAELDILRSEMDACVKTDKTKLLATEMLQFGKENNKNCIFMYVL